MRSTFQALALVGLCAADTVQYTFNVEEWVVDFMRPTVGGAKRNQERVTPFKIPEENRKAAILVNGQYPGATIEVWEDDIVEINVVNKLLSEATTIHWHGIHPYETPWTDGALGLTQAGIAPGANFTYKFRAWPAGTHYYHSHMDGMQSAKGLRGAFVVKKRQEGPQMPAYDEEQLVVLADEWRDPDVCLALEGAMAGNDVCSDIDFGSMNGQVATGNLQKFDERYPYPLLTVQPGKCYRFRMIMMASNAENYIVTMAGHNMTLVALDGVDVEPIMVTSINMHIGERADVIVCADQKPGFYPVEMNYDYACTLTPGHFIPPGFHPVKSCKFYGFLRYDTGRPELLYGAPTSPKGTGGGAKPVPASGVPFDLTNPGDYSKTQPVDAIDEPEEPDARYMVTIGMNGPLYKEATDAPLTKGRWYMDLDSRRASWKKPLTPILHTKGQCGAEGVPFITIPENATNVEIIINNVSPASHNIHMHGMLFQVINVANYEWCNVNKTACFVMPVQANPCPKEDRIRSDNNRTDDKSILDLYWGCGYNASKDKVTQNLTAPLRKDSFEVWQRSWAVIRFNATKPGVWQFHCHMEQHIPLGMVFAINVLPSKQPPIPADVPTEGPCPVWSAPNASSSAAPPAADGALLVQNDLLRMEVAKLETELKSARATE